MRQKQTARKSTGRPTLPTQVQTETLRESEWKSKNHVPYATIIKENAVFEKYYKQLNLIPSGEFDEFMSTLKRPLPITFRITSYKCYANELLNHLKEKHFKYLDEIVKEDGGWLFSYFSYFSYLFSLEGPFLFFCLCLKTNFFQEGFFH